MYNVLYILLDWVNAKCQKKGGAFCKNKKQTELWIVLTLAFVKVNKRRKKEKFSHNIPALKYAEKLQKKVQIQKSEVFCIVHTVSASMQAHSWIEPHVT